MGWPLPRTLSVALGLLLEVVAKSGGVIFGTNEILARDRVGLLLFWFWIRMPAGFTLTRSRFHESRDPGLINKNLLATLN